jgi:RNA polymerase sigma factor (sigma-70 family)
MRKSQRCDPCLGTLRDEYALLKQIAKRDEAALKTLYDLYYPRLARFLVRIVGNSHDAVEIINDVFLVVWNQAADFRGESTFSTWLLAIAYRNGARLLARRKPTLHLEDVTLGDPTGDHAHTTAVWHDLQRALSIISPDQRAVVELTYFFGYSYSEIGEIVGCPENTVKTRMFHARRKLRALAECPAC